MRSILGALAGVLLTASIAIAAPPAPSGTIAIAAGSDLSLGGVIGFDTTVSGLKGNQYPMVAVSCYQDVNGDGSVDTNLLGPDVVFTWLDKPGADFTLGGYSSIWTQRGGGDATCRADLDAYGWKGGRQSIVVLDSIDFHAEG